MQTTKQAGKKTKTLRRRKGFEKKRDLIFNRYFFCIPGIVEELLNFDHFLRLPSAASSAPLRPTHPPQSCASSIAPPVCLTRDGIIGG
jgi:hypothetical protein